jgi:hypothetical protein
MNLIGFSLLPFNALLFYFFYLWTLREETPGLEKAKIVQNFT